MNLSIRRKVILGALASMVAGLAVAGVLAVRSVEQHELARTAETLEARTALVASALEPHLPSAGPALQRIVRELSRQGNARITVIGTDGLVAADSDTPDAALANLENHGARPEVVQALQVGRGMDNRLSQTTGQRMFYFARLVNLSPSSQVVLRLSLPLTVLEERSSDLKRGVGVAFAIAFIVSMICSVFIARGITRPLSEIAVAARRLADGALGHRIRLVSHDEIGVLAQTLNTMADQLESKIQQVTEDRSQLLAILSSMVEGIMVLDGAGRVLQVNPAWERIFSVRNDEAKGRPYREMIKHPELASLTAEVLQKHEALSGEITLSPTRRTLRVEASPVPGEEGGNKPCVVVVFYDITALRRLEQIRKDFVANVSHELRTPLTSIKGYVEALLDGGKDDPRAAEQYLEIVRKQSDRLNLLLDDLLQLAQIESGQIALRQDLVRVDTVFERTMTVMKPLADKKGHALTVAVPDDLPPILGDEERLVQLLTNLLDNAVKYTPAKGAIVVAARRLPRRPSDPRQGMIELSVTDTGMGIPESDRPRVFERFYRVDKARSRELGGTGLGLAIVRHIAEGHGGRVWAEGTLPSGSRFMVTLPIYPDEMRQSELELQIAKETSV